MSTTLDSVQWGTQPKIPLTFAYDMQRDGADMKYKLYITVGTVTGASYFGYPIYTTIKLNGVTVVSAHTIKSASPNRWSTAIEYATDWFTVANKTSGTVPLVITMYSGSGSSRYDDYSFTLPVSDYYVASTMTASGSLIGTIVTFKIKSQSTDLRHTITYSFKNASGTISTKTMLTTVTWIPPMSLCDQYPNANSGVCTFTLQTYIGDILIGSTTTTLTLTVPPSACLTVSTGWATIAPYNTGGAAGIDAYIANISSAAVTFNSAKISTAQAHGATIAGYYIQYNGLVVRSSPYRTNILQASTTVTAAVVDSRGRETKINLPITVYPYAAPTISDISVYRCDSSGVKDSHGTYIYVKATGRYDGVDGHNTALMRARYKEAGATVYGPYTTMQSGTASIIGGGLVLTTHSYVVELSYADSISAPIILTFDIGTEKKFFRGIRGGLGAAFGKVPELVDYLDIAWNLRVRKNLVLGVDGNHIADFVCETGTSGIWEYAKWDSGKAECWCNYVLTGISVTQQAGSEYYAVAISEHTVNYPFTFSEEPNIIMNFYTTNYQIAIPTFNDGNAYVARRSSLPAVMLFRPVQSNSLNGVLSIKVTGKI